MDMKINIISFSFKKGGAAIAAAKFNKLLKVNGKFIVNSINQDSSSYVQLAKRVISLLLSKLQYDYNPIKHSLNLFSYSPALKIFSLHNAGLFHLHWINNDTLSVFDFDKIPLGSIITLHDEWLYCGAEHCYKVLDSTDYFEHGYPLFIKGIVGFPWNSLIWRIKLNKLSNRRDLIYTVPSSWMLERAKRSLILKNADVRLLPNPIDIETFKPLTSDKISQFRMSIGYSNENFIFCFGAVGGKSSYLKGAALLEEALNILHQDLDELTRRSVKILMFGGQQYGDSNYAGFDAFYLGHISNPEDLAKVYASADCVVVPSLVESFGQVAAEALACETPVISFASSGLKDIVTNNVTGLCAEPFSVESLAEKLKMMLEKPVVDRRYLAENGREHVVKNFSYPIIAEQYKLIINDAISLKVG